MLVTLKTVNHFDNTSKKTGKPYVSTSITTNEHGDGKYIKGFGNDSTKQWQRGDKIDLEITDDPQWGLQFKAPKLTDVLSEGVNEVEKQARWLFGEHLKTAKRLDLIESKMGIVGSKEDTLPAIEKKEQATFENVDFTAESEEIPF